MPRPTTARLFKSVLRRRDPRRPEPPYLVALRVAEQERRVARQAALVGQLRRIRLPSGREERLQASMRTRLASLRSDLMHRVRRGSET